MCARSDARCAASCSSRAGLVGRGAIFLPGLVGRLGVHDHLPVLGQEHHGIRLQPLAILALDGVLQRVLAAFLQARVLQDPLHDRLAPVTRRFRGDRERVGELLGPLRHRLVQVRELHDLLVQLPSFARLRRVDLVHALAELFQLRLERQHDRIHLALVHLGQGERALLHEPRRDGRYFLLEEPCLLHHPVLLFGELRQQPVALGFERLGVRRHFRVAISLLATRFFGGADACFERLDALRQARVVRGGDAPVRLQFRGVGHALVERLPQAGGLDDGPSQVLGGLCQRRAQRFTLARQGEMIGAQRPVCFAERGMRGRQVGESRFGDRGCRLRGRCLLLQRPPTATGHQEHDHGGQNHGQQGHDPAKALHLHYAGLRWMVRPALSRPGGLTG